MRRAIVGIGCWLLLSCGDDGATVGSGKAAGDTRTSKTNRTSSAGNGSEDSTTNSTTNVSSGRPLELKWACSVTGLMNNGCRCSKQSVDSFIGLAGSAVTCAGYDCCLLSAAGSASASCECFDSSASCDAQAASRPGTTVVAECPPPGEPSFASAACAKEGVNCGYDYLTENHLSGCCAGTLCKSNAANIRVCQPGSTEEVALSKSCEKAAHSGALVTAMVNAPIRTSVGEFNLDRVQFGFLGVGPGGCVNSLQMTFSSSSSSSSSCTLELDAALTGGRLAVTTVSGNFEGCPGYSGPMFGGLVIETNPSAIPFGVSFNGIACDAFLVFESYCAAGSFDFSLTGTVDKVVFEDQHLIANGVLCNAEPKGECPTP